MNVSELARSVGLSASGVRWYERVGALSAPERKANGYREYNEDDRRLLLLATSLRRLGLTVSEAGSVARACLERTTDSRTVDARLAAHRAQLRERRSELELAEVELADLAETISTTRSRRSSLASNVGPIAVLFVCNSNSGRSQIGEALLARLGRGRFRAVSAGIAPRPVSALAVEALGEVGIDWSEARPKPVEEVSGSRFDYVVTLSEIAREQCPTLPGPHNSLHWSLEDPGSVEGSADERLRAYRRTVDDLQRRLQPFIELALVSHEPSATRN